MDGKETELRAGCRIRGLTQPGCGQLGRPPGCPTPGLAPPLLPSRLFCLFSGYSLWGSFKGYQQVIWQFPPKLNETNYQMTWQLYFWVCTPEN